MSKRWMSYGCLVVAASFGVVSSTAEAQAIISNGTVLLGVDTRGQLNVGGGVSSRGGNGGGTTVVGLRFRNAAGVQYESTAEGCLCEGWGVAVSGGSNFAGVQGFADNSSGISNTTVESFTNTATTARSSVLVRSGGTDVMRVVHDFTPTANPFLFQVEVSVTNLTTGTLGSAVNGIRYKRQMDWDINPTTFRELSTIGGLPAENVMWTSNDGFGTPSALVEDSFISCGSAGNNINFVDAGLEQNGCDHGAEFIFGFPQLAAGATRAFKIFYGAAPTEAQMFAALGSVGAEIFSLGQCAPGLSASDECTDLGGGPATFAFGFAGVGGTALPDPSVVPEPSTYALMATGLLGVLGVARRRNAKA